MTPPPIQQTQATGAGSPIAEGPATDQARKATNGGDPDSPATRQVAGQRAATSTSDGGCDDDGCYDGGGEGQARPASGRLPRPPQLTRQTVTVLRALHLDPAAARDLRYLTTHTGLSRATIRSILDRLTRCQWASVEQDPHDASRARPRHLYRLTDYGTHAARHVDHDQAVGVFRWDDPRSPRLVTTDNDLDLILAVTAVHPVPLSVPWPMIEVTTSPSRTPVLWYATTRHRGVLLWPDPASGTILAAHHPDVPAAPAPIAFTTPDGQLRTLDSRYTQLRAHDARAALQRWWRTHTQPTLAFRPTPLRIPPCSQ